MLRFGKRKAILDKMKTFLIYIIFLLTMLGTSTASGNVSEEGKTCVIFPSSLFAIFFLNGVSFKQKCWARTKIIIFPRLILLLPKSYKPLRQRFIQKC